MNPIQVNRTTNEPKRLSIPGHELKLLPCPFCGGQADIELIETIGDTRKAAGCNTEFCQGYQSAHAFATHREAAEAWNKRHLLTEIQHWRIWTDKRQRIDKALETMTDEWIANGQYCEDTVTTLRDALKAVMEVIT